MSATRIELEPAYILHTRAYRETSQLLEIITPAYGRMGVVANGARRPKSAFRGYLNPFQALRLSWSGRGELMRLSAVESAGPLRSLPGESLMAGFYANELLLRLLERGDAHPELFVHYGALIDGLSRAEDTELLLRRFEMALLDELGYALDLTKDCVEQLPLLPDRLYELQIGYGLVPVASDGENALIYTGAQLTAVAKLDFSERETRRIAKRLLRSALNFYLGGRPLRTREVAAAMRR